MKISKAGCYISWLAVAILMVLTKNSDFLVPAVIFAFLPTCFKNED